MGKGWSSFFRVSVFRMLSSETATLETFTYKKLSYQSTSPNLKPPRSWNKNGQQQKTSPPPHTVETKKWRRRQQQQKKSENRLSISVKNPITFFLFPFPTSGTGASTVHFKSPSWRSIGWCPRKMRVEQGESRLVKKNNPRTLGLLKASWWLNQPFLKNMSQVKMGENLPQFSGWT